MGKTPPPRKCPAGQQLVSPGTKSERCATVVSILPPKPKPKPKPAAPPLALTADFLETLPQVPGPTSSGTRPPSSAPSSKIFGLPRTAVILGGGALALGLVGYLVLRGRK
jgi:hypothetical protein